MRSARWSASATLLPRRRLLAVDEAERLGDRAVDSEHLLLGLVRAGSIVVQRSRFEDNTQIAGCLGEAVGRVDGRQALPSWALRREDLASLVRLR